MNGREQIDLPRASKLNISVNIVSELKQIKFLIFVDIHNAVKANVVMLGFYFQPNFTPAIT